MPPFLFHPGERAVQLRAGEAAIADRNGSVIAASILGGARGFISKQFMVVLASSDADGRVWSSVLYGKPGFVSAAGDALIALEVASGRRDSADPFWANIAANPAVGLLFIELGTRRRYRINGVISHEDEAGLEITVQEAYPNCPKYIQRRELRALSTDGVADGVATGNSIGGSVEALLRAADTVFVASVNTATGADASHRGGPPGFVQVIGPHTLRIPDYHGNSIFNTLGNLEVDARFGLSIPDFEGGRLLQLSGRARLLWDQDDPYRLTGGTGRFLEVTVERWILRHIAERLEWEYLDASPFNPAGPGRIISSA
ncbi:pyridoxamine 5'-phosphate oxidase family protein [Telluria aromaticivorans]|nr:pyridoxamine 5'-phosphate oxidase family protein [Telluria aromaticivorans]